MHRIYFLDREDQPLMASTVHAAVEVRSLWPVEYRSNNAYGDWVTEPTTVSRDEAAAILRQARFDGWQIKRVTL